MRKGTFPTNWLTVPDIRISTLSLKDFMLHVSLIRLLNRIKISVKFFGSDKCECSKKVLEFTSVKTLLDIFSHLPKKFLLHGNVGGKKLPEELAELIFWRY